MLDKLQLFQLDAANMKVWDENKNQDQPIYTPAYLKCFLQIFSLDSGQTKVRPQEKCRYLAKAIIMASLLTAILIYTFNQKAKLTYPYVNISIVLTDIIQLVYDYIQYLIDLYFVYKYGREISKEYFNQYASFDRILTTVDYKEVSRRQVKLFISFMVLWLIVSVTDYVGWWLSYGWFISLIWSPGYLYMLLKMLTNLDLTGQVINIECRLRIIGDAVQDVYCKTPKLLPNVREGMKDAVEAKNWFYSGLEQKSTYQLKILQHPDYHEMKWLSRCYLLLFEQCVFIGKMFGIRILLNSLSFLIDMVRFLNTAVRYAVGSQNTAYDSGYLPVIGMLLRLLECTIVVSSLVHHSEAAYRQRDRIVHLCNHLLINKDPGEEN